MTRALLLRLLPLLLAAVPAAAAPEAAEAPREIPRIILPGAAMGGTAGAAPRLILPEAAKLAAPPAGLIVPQAQVLQAPAPAILAAARPLTEAESHPQKLPGKDELAALAKALSPQAEGAPAPSEAARGMALGAAFDGTLAPEAAHWEDVSARFARGPNAPSLPTTVTAARSLIARLLPSLYKRVPVHVVLDVSDHPRTGHVWTEDGGHVIEVAPSRPDARGEVASAFGEPGRARVQQKIERLLEVSHEYLHSIFDAVVGPSEHAGHTAYAAATEGFAVGAEQLLVEQLLDNAPRLGLSPRDAMDLSALAAARREWLDLEDTHYAEGILAWRRVFAESGLPGMRALLEALSGKRMAAVSRAEPAYQLALGEPALLSAYLGRDAAAPARRGLEAYAKAARGEALTEAETREAEGVVARAGPEAWRRLFERTFLPERRVHDPNAPLEPTKWWEDKRQAPPPAEQAFALARLSPQAGHALARFLAATIAQPGGAAKLFGAPGPQPRLNEIAAGAEALPWDAASRAAWDAGLKRWLFALN